VKADIKKHILDVAEISDAYRLIPRLMIIGYGYMLYETTFWFMALPDANSAHAAFIATVWGAASVFSGFYFQTGKKWK
jgi:hypothetical protein